MTLSVTLRGYPEAVLATDSITLEASPIATAGSVVRDLARLSPKLSDALLHANGVPRQTTKVLVDGTPVSHDANVSKAPSLVVLASLPCDG